MTRRKQLLIGLLRPILQEWGSKEVEAAIAEIASDTRYQGDERGAAIGRLASIEKRRGSTKPLASALVERARLPQSHANALRELAMRFDRKQFLPSISDVREFLVMLGENPGVMKDRSESFRRLLRALSELPPERLDQLAASALHSGPSQLGPLSDAISAAAASLPRNRKPGDT